VGLALGVGVGVGSVGSPPHPPTNRNELTEKPTETAMKRHTSAFAAFMPATSARKGPDSVEEPVYHVRDAGVNTCVQAMGIGDK